MSVSGKRTGARPLGSRWLAACVAVLLVASAGCEGDGNDNGSDRPFVMVHPSQ